MGPRADTPESMPRRLASSAGRRRAVIGLTPLIDVVFILLVFFMLASSFLDWRAIDLKAPAAAVAAAGTGMEGALLVEVRQDGVRLSGERLSTGALEARVAERLAESPERRIVVRPAAGLELQRVVTVLDALEAAGARELSLSRGPGG